MASLGNGGFDSTTVEPSAGFDLIPAGQYVAEITASGQQQTKDGRGSYIKLTWQICDGKFANRKLWQNLNLDNPNQEAVNIAKAELSAICRAVGVPRPTDTEQLHFKRCRVTISHKKNKQSGEMEARLSKWEPMGAAAPTPTPGATTGTQGATSTPPWKKTTTNTPAQKPSDERPF